jgi:hypothetical protein
MDKSGSDNRRYVTNGLLTDLNVLRQSVVTRMVNDSHDGMASEILGTLRDLRDVTFRII